VVLCFILQVIIHQVMICSIRDCCGRAPLASGPRYSVLEIAHRYRSIIPSLERNIAFLRERGALFATVSSRPPQNPSCTYLVCFRIAFFPPNNTRSATGPPAALTTLYPSVKEAYITVFRLQVPRTGQKYLTRLHL
jgi:hypothetical protein